MDDPGPKETVPAALGARARAPDRVRWHDVDEEAGRANRATASLPNLGRTRSQGSMSIRSVRSGSGAVDPSAVLPIQYRTM